MPFSIHDLRYHLDESYPIFYAYVRRQAQRELGPFGNDTYEVDQVVERVFGIAEARKVSPSPRPSTSGEAFFAQTISSGDWVDRTTIA